MGFFFFDTSTQQKCHFWIQVSNKTTQTISSGRAIVLPPAWVLALASASTNVKVFVKVFKTSLFPNLSTDLIYLW